MISFKKYIEDLFESRDKSYTVEWKNIGEDLIGYFSGDKEKYRILFINKPFDCFLIKFQVLSNGEWSFRGGKNNNIIDTFSVFGTLEKELDKFIDDRNPEYLIFFSLEPGSRNSIYLRYCNNVVEKFKDYNYEEISIQNKKCFFVFKEKLTEDEYKILIDSLREENYNYDEFD